MRGLLVAVALGLALSVFGCSALEGGFLASTPTSSIDAAEKSPVLIDAAAATLYTAVTLALQEDAITADQAEAYQLEIRRIRLLASQGSVALAEIVINQLLGNADFAPVAARVERVG